MSAVMSRSGNANSNNEKVNNNGWLILAAIMLPMVSAYFIFKTGIGMPTGTVNKGELLRPATSVTALDYVNQDGKKVRPFDGKKLWRMVIVADDRCDDVCRQQLYLSRQVHIRLAEKSVRVERLFLNTGAPLSQDFAEFLKQEHPRLQALQIVQSQWRDTFSETSIADHPLNGSHIYYLDQEGYAMMSYDSEHSGADLLDDIKRLLKYSYEE
ncbi:MAG: hypothetical protein AseanaTS_11720 [Candidatus Pelagadaptatus aseana]|uniref:hypothetical protein n=1 Tax=Candidatus Pelagadaptatus aseana TaxID=3120508 RepID=UPI0039B363BC